LIREDDETEFFVWRENLSLSIERDRTDRPMAPHERHDHHAIVQLNGRACSSGGNFGGLLAQHSFKLLNTQRMTRVPHVYDFRIRVPEKSGSGFEDDHQLLDDL
jgi:hypothetical protein